jgi:hypothetical protein
MRQATEGGVDWRFGLPNMPLQPPPGRARWKTVKGSRRARLTGDVRQIAKKDWFAGRGDVVWRRANRDGGLGLSGLETSLKIGGRGLPHWRSSGEVGWGRARRTREKALSSNAAGDGRRS